MQDPSNQEAAGDNVSMIIFMFLTGIIYDCMLSGSHFGICEFTWFLTVEDHRTHKGVHGFIYPVGSLLGAQEYFTQYVCNCSKDIELFFFLTWLDHLTNSILITCPKNFLCSVTFYFQMNFYLCQNMEELGYFVRN